MRVGDKVQILRTDIKDLNHRTNRYGRITGINGEYIYVKPMWCRWVIELYRSEVASI